MVPGYWVRSRLEIEAVVEEMSEWRNEGSGE